MFSLTLVYHVLSVFVDSLSVLLTLIVILLTLTVLATAETCGMIIILDFCWSHCLSFIHYLLFTIDFLVVNYFHKKSLSSMYDKVLNMPMTRL